MSRRRARAATILLLSLFAGGAGTAGPPEAADKPSGGTAAAGAAQVIPGGALDADCAHVAGGLGGPGYQFIVPCPGRALSPDGRFAVVRKSGEEGGVFLGDRAGRELDEIPNLGDGMPFVIFWSPRSNWFFANHYLGSSLERLRVFEIVDRTATERSSVFAEATREMVRRYPCLGHQANIVASGWRWSRDGRRIAMTAYARPDSCGETDARGQWQPGPAWHPLWMIGDVETGKIDPASVRVRRDGVAPLPKDGPYAGL